MKRGVSIATLTATVTIMIILITTVTISASNMLNNVKRTNFATEISSIQKSVDSYLQKNENDYPILGSVLINLDNVSEESKLQFTNNGENITNNVITLFNIDYEKIGYTDLKYGNKENGENDIYVLSGLTGKVYYAAGFKVGNEVYYTLTDELKKKIEYKTTDSIVEDGNDIISYSQENLENSEKKITVKIPVSYVVTSVKVGDTSYSATTENEYYIYEITGTPGTMIDIVYTYNGEMKSTSYTVKATNEKTNEGYAKDGLILHYDGINNTGNGHSSTTTVWKDLSGNGNDGELYHVSNTQISGWNKEYLALGGVDDYVATLKTATSDELLENGNITLEVVFKYMDLPTSAVRFIVNVKFEGGTPGKALYIADYGKNNLLLDARGNIGAIGKYIPYSIEVEKIYKMTSKLDYNNNSTTTYFSVNNDILVSTTHNSKIVNNTDNRIYIGGVGANYNNNIKVYSVRIYNRALTEDEIKQNYNVDKSRFGI